MSVKNDVRGVIFALALGVCPLYASNAFAVAFEEGDVFGAVAGGRVAHYDSAGNFIEILDTTRGGFTTGMAFDEAGNLYVTNFSDNSVSRFDSDGNLINAQFVTTDAGSAVESIVFDAAGNFYVGQADGTRDILKFDAAGNLLQRFDVATEVRGSDWIDLAADQQTLFYTSEGDLVKRYDVSTDTQLADFSDLSAGTNAFALRLLDDGGLLVSDSIDIKRLDSAGNITQTYDAAGNDNWFSLNLDPDGTSFWAGDFGTNDLFKFDIVSGAQLQTIDTNADVISSQLFGVTVFGEITQAVPPPTDVPEPTSWLLFGMGLLGLGFGAYRSQVQLRSASSKLPG